MIWHRWRTLFSKLDQILVVLVDLTQQERQTMATLADLQSEVARNTSIDESAKLLLAGLAAKIQELLDAGADPVALQTLVDQLKADNDALAAAVGANTI
mgnify:CR=1 FL=1